MTETLIRPTRRGLILGAGALTAACATTRPSARSDAARFPATQAVLDGWVAAGKVPGATVGLRNADGTNAWLQAGRLDHDPASRPVDRNSLFRIYSMTKPITGAATALLIEDGRLTLDTPVADFVPELARVQVATSPLRSLDARAPTTVMTVRHLLTHTAGFIYHFYGDQPVAAAYRRAGIFPVTGYNLSTDPLDGPKVRDLDEMARRLGEIPLVADPGTAYAYSLSLDVMGLVIQRASGMAFPDFVQRRLFDPIGMDDTIWQLRPGDSARFSALYDYKDGGRVARDDPRNSDYARPVTLFAGGAGLVSSTQDYLAFLTTILDGGRAGRVTVMKPETARLIRTDILPTAVPEAEGQGHGFAGSVDRTTGEYGWSGAAGTVAWLDPSAGTAVTVMLQRFNQAIDVDGDIREALALDAGA
ncbi:serine hydrolase domain-containing protein [Brevundimonas variabilis]|uniref:CubicO group peptidase (Beta-lactamase class C family) n=1 Tax=Brevundimonas variabilis TaxID=74312 RepID=A0A7W9CJS9_9CAUL|nr:serine hydrolase domain-containing protein [Brevundimonas variabilis]MBB5746993.1 CubicO group peptidase (beta-lactamase class C family) [Brevundimonas variabilis]